MPEEPLLTSFAAQPGMPPEEDEEPPLLLLFPAVLTNPPLRFSLSALLVSTAYGMSVVEAVRVRDGLRSRLPLAMALGLQAAMAFARAPLAIFADPPIFTYTGTWFAAIVIEAVVFAQVVSYLVISLPKERAEQALQRAALSDSLTGLQNRRAFYDGAQHPSYSMASFTPSTVPGCRLPHLWLRDGRSIYDALGPEYTLLRFDPSVDVTTMTEAAAADGFPLTLVDIDAPHADDIYGYPLLVVRPDRHVAWRGRAIDVPPSEMIARLRGDVRDPKAGTVAAA